MCVFFCFLFFQSQMSVNLNMCWQGVSNMKSEKMARQDNTIYSSLDQKEICRVRLVIPLPHSSMRRSVINPIPQT